MNLPNPVVSSALAAGGRLAVVAEDGRLTYDELHRAVRAASLTLSAHLNVGDRVGLWGPPTAAYVVAFHALFYLGAEVAPLSERGTFDELAAALRTLKPTSILVVGPTSEAAERAFAEAGLPVIPLAATVLSGGLSPADAEAIERWWPDDEPRLCILTSGTTGAPKAVSLSTAQLTFGAMGSALRLGHLPTDRWLGCLPLHHIGGAMIVFRCALYGTTLELHPRFDARLVSERLRSGEVTQVSLVPPMLEALVEAQGGLGGNGALGGPPAHALLRLVLVGGGPMSTSLRRRCQSLGLPVATTWGMTESAAQVATATPGDVDGILRPLPFVRVTADDDGRLVLRGPQVGHERLVTSDLGRVHEDGSVTVLGRLDDLIVSGGAKISPSEVEAVLEAHPDVAECVVVGLPDDRFGARPLALIVLRDVVESLDVEGLRVFCRQALTPYKCPDVFLAVPREAFPRSALGKLDRPALIESLPDLLSMLERNCP